MTKSFTIGNEKLKITRVGLIDVRVVNFVDDAVGDGEPEPACGVIGRADPFLCALRPARLRSGRAEGRSLWGAGDS